MTGISFLFLFLTFTFTYFSIYVDNFQSLINIVIIKYDDDYYYKSETKLERILQETRLFSDKIKLAIYKHIHTGATDLHIEFNEWIEWCTRTIFIFIREKKWNFLMIIFKRMKKKIESDVHSFNDYNFTCHFCFQFDNKKKLL